MTARHRLRAARQHLSASLEGSPRGLLAWLPWLPALVGIGIALGFTIYGVALRVGDAGETPQFEVPAGADHAAGHTSPPFTPSPTAAVATTPPPTESPPPPTESPPPPATSEPLPDVIGTYRLKESFEEAFIAQVAVINQSGHAQDWTVQLQFPGNVDKLLDFWVDNEQQPELAVEGRHITFTSTAPVDPQSQVVLNVKLARSGDNVDPETCVVNGSHCLF